MGWDLTLNLDGATMRGAILPPGRHLVEISDFQVGEKENVGPRGEFTLKAVEGPDKGKTIRVMPYIVGKDFKGTEGQAGWGKDMWYTLITTCGVNPKKVNGKSADQVGKALVGQQLVVTVSESPARETAAERKAREAKGTPAPTFTNVDSFHPKEDWDGYTLEKPDTQPDDEPEDDPEPESADADDDDDEDEDGFSLDDLS